MRPRETMKTLRSIRVRAGAATFALFLAAGAHAQMGGMPGMGMGRGGPPGAPDTSRGTAPPSPLETISNQLFQARMRLLIGREQALAWERFQGAFLSVRMNGMPPAPVAARSSAAQAMQLQLGAAQDRYARMEDLAEALKALLALLDDRQRQDADDVLSRLLLDHLEGARLPAVIGNMRGG